MGMGSTMSSTFTDQKQRDKSKGPGSGLQVNGEREEKEKESREREKDKEKGKGELKKFRENGGGLGLGLTFSIVRYPALIIVGLIVIIELLIYTLLIVFVRGLELITSHCSKFSSLKTSNRNAQDFLSWVKSARELDRCEGRDSWKKDPSSPFYDHALVNNYRRALETCREKNDFQGMMRILRTIYNSSNPAGINNKQIYSQTHFGTKVRIQSFIQDVLEASILVRDCSSIPLQTRISFFRAARKSYGRTALLLSGGAALGYMHIGVIKALYEAGCLPKIMTGASAGSLVGSFVAVRTDKELEEELFNPDCNRFFTACEDPMWVRIKRWFKTGYMFNVKVWIRKMKIVTKGDTTFAEAYSRTGRIFNVAVTSSNKHAPCVLLNYKTSPDVVIWSAVLASSAFPNMIEPIELMYKNSRGELCPYHVHGKSFRDGTIKNDIPIREVGKQWNANFFIVSQVNPHVLPFFYNARGGLGKPGRHAGSGHRGGFITSMILRFLKLDMKKWLQLLADLDLLPDIFGVDWRFIFSQPLTGTVTITPDASIGQFIRIMSDSTRDQMLQNILTGERATWPQLIRITNHYRFDKMLAESLKALQKQAGNFHDQKVNHNKFNQNYSNEYEYNQSISHSSFNPKEGNNNNINVVNHQVLINNDSDSDDQHDPHHHSAGSNSNSKLSSVSHIQSNYSNYSSNSNIPLSSESIKSSLAALDAEVLSIIDARLMSDTDEHTDTDNEDREHLEKFKPVNEL